MLCPICHEPNREEAIFCATCGNDLRLQSPYADGINQVFQVLKMESSFVDSPLYWTGQGWGTIAEAFIANDPKEVETLNKALEYFTENGLIPSVYSIVEVDIR